MSGRLAWWGTSWLRGYVVTDLAIDAVLADDVTHVVTGLPELDGAAPLAGCLAALRATGADGIGVAIPVYGDPVGLGGPRGFNAAALEAGEACLSGGLGLVPARVGSAVEWTVYAADRRQLPDVGEADRVLRQALPAAADALAALDVARWRPEVADLVLDLHHPPRLEAPPGVPARCVDLAARSLQAGGIVDAALADDCGALTAPQVEQRRRGIEPLAAAARRALVAACSPEVWPPGG